MKIFVVADEGGVYGAYSDGGYAAVVAIVMQTDVGEVELNKIPSGFEDDLEQYLRENANV